MTAVDLRIKGHLLSRTSDLKINFPQYKSKSYVAKVPNGHQAQVADGHLGQAPMANVGHLGLGSKFHPSLKWLTDLKV